MTRRPAMSLLPILLILAGCTTSTPDVAPTTPASASPFADCATLVSAPASPSAPASSGAPGGPATPVSPSAPATPTGRTGTGSPQLAGLTLPCFTGGAPVALDALPGPAVINLWASWCQPCRKELPAFQRFAERAGDTVRVLGVNTGDDRPRAESIGVDFNISFPNLYDPQERLRLRLARPFLPITLFVDGHGEIRHLDESGALDEERLAELVREHLKVVVPV